MGMVWVRGASLCGCNAVLGWAVQVRAGESDGFLFVDSCGGSI